MKTCKNDADKRKSPLYAQKIITNKGDLLEEMFYCYSESLYDKFDGSFGTTADITQSQRYDVQRILKNYSTQIEHIINLAYGEMEEWMNEEHIHWVDEYDEDCEMCAQERQDKDWEDSAADYNYRRSV
jgi:hypothetical protein